MDLALTREVSPRIGGCELSFIERQPIDYARAVAQHREYCRLLETIGLEVLRLAADSACPDCCFVEDAAVVLDEVAVLGRMGAASRRPESPAIAEALAPYRPLVALEPPATLEGGDVLRIGKQLFVGLSKRTNAVGVEVLRRAAVPHGYSVAIVEVRGCLHLKSAVTMVDDQTLIANVIWVDPKAFPGFEVLPIPLKEPLAANVLRVRDRVVVHAGFPRTVELLEKRGLSVMTVDVSEFLKAEAGLTCKSILFRRT
jgi:dimethylargininase